jgi:hypothetical protein
LAKILKLGLSLPRIPRRMYSLLTASAGRAARLVCSRPYRDPADER